VIGTPRTWTEISDIDSLGPVATPWIGQPVNGSKNAQRAATQDGCCGSVATNGGMHGGSLSSVIQNLSLVNRRRVYTRSRPQGMVLVGYLNPLIKR
jgi:hypothetical protein